MILIGRYLSPFTRRVAISLGLLDLPFEHRPLSPWQPDQLAELRRLNPVGRVPALVLDDGEVLFESNAIVDYLDEIVGPGRALTPVAGAARREVLRLNALALGVIEKAVAARYEVVQRPPEKIHESWLEHNREQMRGGLAGLEERVAGPWLTGERLTQADVSAVVMLDFVGLVSPELVPGGAWPALAALAERAAGLPPVIATRP